MDTNRTGASKAISQILAAFENGNLPKAIAYSTFNPPSNIPAYKWTQRNRALAFLSGTGDARGFVQWKEAGRYVKKGSKAVYILGPIMVKWEPKEVIEFEDFAGDVHKIDNMKCVGYHAIPVFRMEDTEGEPLEYAQLETKTLPLADVAEHWGLDVKAGAFNGEYYGYYSHGKREIVMATNNERTFLHELSHAAHYRIDPEAAQAPEWEREIIAELSASTLLYMLGKDGHMGNSFKYISRYAEQANLSIKTACMKILDTCISVINEIVSASQAPGLKAA